MWPRKVGGGLWRATTKSTRQATRQRIIDTAGRRFKRDGIDGSGIATFMADAGLTNGAFYAHFDSKDDLVATVVADQLHKQADNYSSAPGQLDSSSSCASTCPPNTATTVNRLPIRGAARRDRSLYDVHQAGLHRWRAGHHRRDRLPPSPG